MLITRFSIFFKCLGLLLIVSMAGCQSLKRENSTLYEDLGGTGKLEQFADNFIEEIGYNPIIIHQFENTDLEQFRTRFIEHMCVIADGPCIYQGQEIEAAHKGMNITEVEFNSTVDTMIKAMKRTGWTVDLRNRLLDRFAVFRNEILYR